MFDLRGDCNFERPLVALWKYKYCYWSNSRWLFVNKFYVQVNAQNEEGHVRSFDHMFHRQSYVTDLH